MDRCSLAMRYESKGTKSGDSRSIEASCCHRGTTVVISGRASEELFGAAGGALPDYKEEALDRVEV